MTTVFLDTSPLLSGLIDFGPQSAPAQEVMHAVAEKRLIAATAWHCCLELFSVSTRLPPEYRLSPKDAVLMIEEEVLARMRVHELPEGSRLGLFRAAADDGVTGGRIYDAHIADIARSAGVSVIVTDNRRHFLASLRHGIRVETTAEFSRSLKSSHR
jgi:predicted nucleic acid-binding protein